MRARTDPVPGGTDDAPRPEPATRKEEALWLLDRLVPGAGVNNLSFTFRVRGSLDPAVLQEAVTLLLRRHETLRTVFRPTGDGLTRQVLGPDEATADVLPVPAGDGPDGTRRTLTAFVAAPFAYDGRPLLRVGHLRGTAGDAEDAEDAEDVVCLVVHHLVFDTISAGILLGELVSAYTALATGLPPEPELLEPAPALHEPEPGSESLAHWHRQLQGFDPAALELAYGRQEAGGATLAGDQLTVTLPDDVRAAVTRLRTDLHTSEAVVLLAAYALLLARHGGGPDLSVGTMVNVRGQDAPQAVGYHVNVVPLRIAVDLADGFRSLAERAATAFLDGIAHADVPVDSLYNEVTRDGGGWRNSLFRHVFNYVPGLGLTDFRIAGLDASPLVVEVPYSKFDLEFFVMSTDDELRLRLVYSSDVFTRTEAAALLDRYQALLRSLAADPDRPTGEAALWSAHDHAVIGRGGPSAGTPPEPVPAAVRRTALATPDAVAVEDADTTLTYRRLWETATAVGGVLRGHGIGPGDVVALLAPRGAPLAAATLGVWLAGAVHLPLDPDHPAHRIAYQLADSGARAVLAGRPDRVPAPEGVPVLDLAEAVAAPVPDDEPPPAPEPGAPAYLIYTSGSTGRPKGTLVSHGGLANVVAHFAGELAARPGEGTLWMTTYSFDISALELLLPLVTGGRLVIAPDAARSDGRLLARLLRDHRVDIVQATPTTWRLVTDACAESLAGLRVLCGGEPLPPALARRLTATGCLARNVYGPTETTIWSTSGPIRADGTGPVDVGRPIRDTRVFIADPDGRELPVGVRGELCVAGGGVAIGYHDRPDLTADRFRDHPRHGRHYRTGDLARWRPDGTLEVLGRVDRQVKLRGNRIELGEVESTLLAHPAVRAAAAVVVDGDGPDTADARLVAFLVAEETPGLVAQVWEHARAGLPAAAIPGEFLLIDALPTTGNHKVDHLALARLAREHAQDAEAETADTPDDELTARLVTLWQNVLGRTDLHAHSHFFTSGGHSLLAAKLAQSIEEELGTRLQLAEIFTRPTPAQLAEFLRAGGA
ncbi:amino acid adenylation domain-containing protein [Streptomyces sp. NPDC021100]|uniref:amino acid adenylation domain-containing protein n=1 Tax=Streptomyces sp. NPDC021100 TaxID=3365114 RepID=UPI0037AE36FD